MRALTSRLTIIQRLYIGVAAFVVVALVSSVTSLVLTGHLATAENELGNRATPYVTALGDAATGLKATANDERGFMLTGDAEFVTEINEKRKPGVEEDLAAAEKLYPAGSPQAKGVAELRGKINAWYAQLDKEFALRATDPEAASAEALGASRDIRKDYEKSLDGLKEQALAGAAVAHSTFSSESALAKQVAIGALVLSLLLGGAIGWWLVSSIRGPLAELRTRMEEIADGDGDLTQRLDDTRTDEIGAVSKAFNRLVARVQGLVTEVSAAAAAVTETARQMADGASQADLAMKEIAGTVDAVAQGSSEQARVTANVSETAESMAGGVTNVAEGGHRAAEATRDAGAAAREGSARVERATEAMRRIEASVASVGEVGTGLGERGEQIEEIVTTITNIAGQTNLLALNAAIEAARAGENGRGFAVVADEVRSLAEEVQSAAGSIGHIVRDIQSETSRAVEAMYAGRDEVTAGTQTVQSAGEAFVEIEDGVNRVADEVEQVAGAAQVLAAGAVAVKDGAASVAAVSQENAASAQEVAASSEQTASVVGTMSRSAEDLRRQADGLTSLVGHFTV